MSKQKELPSKTDLLEIVKGTPVMRTYDEPPEVKAAEAAMNKRYAVLMKDPEHRRLQKRYEAIRRAHYERCEKHNQEKLALIRAINLDGVTPAIVKRVKKFVAQADKE